MAKENTKKSIRYAPQYRAEVDNIRYDYQPNDRNHERAISRKEIRNAYDQMYRNEQERDQRAFQRIKESDNRFYAGLDPRRRQEVADAGMIFEDHRAMANLSPTAIHRQFPKSPFYSTPYIDDTMRSMREDDAEPEIGY